MGSAPRQRRPRGFVAKRLYQLQHAPRPVFRAVLVSVATGGGLAATYLVYDLSVERALRRGVAAAALPGGADHRAAAVALVVVLTLFTGSLLTYLVVPQQDALSGRSRRSGWSAMLGLFASLPVAYIALVVESQILKPLLLPLITP